MCFLLDSDFVEVMFVFGFYGERVGFYCIVVLCVYFFFCGVLICFIFEGRIWFDIV